MQERQTETMQEFCDRLGIGIKVYGRDSTAAERRDEWLKTAFHWVVTLTYAKNSLTTDYHTGSGCVERSKKRVWDGRRGEFTMVPRVPTIADVVNSLACDASCVDGRTFSEWCMEFGYDDDSIKAKQTYEACQRISEELREFLGRVEFLHLLSGNVEQL